MHTGTSSRLALGIAALVAACSRPPAPACPCTQPQPAQSVSAGHDDSGRDSAAPPDEGELTDDGRTADRSSAVADQPPIPAAGHRVVDLTHPLREDMPVWPGGIPFEKTRLADYDEGYRFHRFEVGENTGTHVDAPAHFIEGGNDIDDIDPRALIAPAVVIDVQREVAADPDYALDRQAITAWEQKHGPIEAGTLVIANTGWHRRFSDPNAYVNQDDNGTMHFPGYSSDGAKLLVERDVAGIAIDTLSIDPGPSEDFAAHRVMLGAGKYQIENLANLHELPPRGATVVVGVLPVAEGSQAQARVLALMPR